MLKERYLVFDNNDEPFCVMKYEDDVILLAQDHMVTHVKIPYFDDFSHANEFYKEKDIKTSAMNKIKAAGLTKEEAESLGIKL